MPNTANEIKACKTVMHENETYSDTLTCHNFMPTFNSKRYFGFKWFDGHCMIDEIVNKTNLGINSHIFIF